jgi:hypothetical protein
MICPHCKREVEEEKAPVLLKINGKPQKIVKRTATKKRYIWVNDEEVLRVLPIPVLVVKAENPARVFNE